MCFDPNTGPWYKVINKAPATVTIVPTSFAWHLNFFRSSFSILFIAPEIYWNHLGNIHEDKKNINYEMMILVNLLLHTWIWQPLQMSWPGACCSLHTRKLVMYISAPHNRSSDQSQGYISHTQKFIVRIII